MLRQIDSRSRESFPHAREIAIAWGQLDRVLEWCRQELAHEWRWQLTNPHPNLPGRYVFYFDAERDLLAFVMKWT
jgi:hypothetical protein